MEQPIKTQGTGWKWSHLCMYSILNIKNPQLYKDLRREPTIRINVMMLTYSECSTDLLLFFSRIYMHSFAEQLSEINGSQLSQGFDIIFQTVAFIFFFYRSRK